ncbi:MAG: SDR family oxidoreductase [Planctomycetaceae bacterium]|nr:SDR family oxidoreductase [Planctomycetaceae bacterium]
MSKERPLSEKTAVITGGGSGICAAIARGLADLGTRVVVAGRNLDKLQSVAAHRPERIIPIVADVANRASVEHLIQEATTVLGQIDIFVNGAGINVPRRMMHNLSPEDWQRMLDINVSGAFHCSQVVLPQMRGRRDGIIINISSIAGLRSAPLGGVGYNASKFAMTALGIACGDEERVNGIRVTNIYPGEVETPILEHRPTPVTDEHRARILQPEDVAAAVLMVVQLPARARVSELTIIPTSQSFI